MDSILFYRSATSDVVIVEPVSGDYFDGQVACEQKVRKGFLVIHLYCDEIYAEEFPEVCKYVDFDFDGVQTLTVSEAKSLIGKLLEFAPRRGYYVVNSSDPDLIS